MKTQQTNKLLFLFIVLTKLSFSQFLITDSLKANYSFAGNTLDESGRNNHGALIGNPTLTTDRFGNPNCAYQFYGDTNSYIKVNYYPDFDIPDYKSFTISLWYQGGSANEFDGETVFLQKKINAYILVSE